MLLEIKGPISFGSIKSVRQVFHIYRTLEFLIAGLLLSQRHLGMRAFKLG